MYLTARADGGWVRIGLVFDEVLAAAQAGAEWGWERLFASIAGPLRGYLRAHGADDPDELTGEVLLQLVRGIHRFEGDEAGFRSWVFLVAHHRLVDERRRAGRAERGRQRLDPPEHGAGADVEALDGSVPEVWRERLARLSEDQRDVLLLRVVGGLSADEVGAILGKSAGAVRVLQHRALVRLRAELEAGVTR